MSSIYHDYDLRQEVIQSNSQGFLSVLSMYLAQTHVCIDLACAQSNLNL